MHSFDIYCNYFGHNRVWEYKDTYGVGIKCEYFCPGVCPGLYAYLSSQPVSFERVSSSWNPLSDTDEDIDQ